MKKLYIIVRKDLTTSQMAVQAGHTVAQYLLHSHFSRWQNETLIYLGVKNLNQLEKLKCKLDIEDINYIEFREPDLNNEVTAIASDITCKHFKRLNLL